MCPCTKIPYPADGLHDQQGADAIHAAALAGRFHPGDILMGFSLGVQIISLYLAQHPGELPVGVHVLLAGDTLAQNARFNATNQGIPLDIATDVTMVINEYDGWSDSPDLTGSPNYALATSNAIQGTSRLHYYALVDLGNPANVVMQQGNITTVLIPTRNLPNNDWMRMGPSSSADALDAQQRPLIDTAYSRAKPTADQIAGASAEQVPIPNPGWANNPEPSIS
jgi:hypothetical protein